MTEQMKKAIAQVFEELNAMDAETLMLEIEKHSEGEIAHLLIEGGIIIQGL